MLSRLKERGFVENERYGVWKLTARGVAQVKKVLMRREEISTPSKQLRRDLIIAFDIPERDAGQRQWLRGILKSIGFRMLQKSMWFGPSPLPKSLIEELQMRHLLPHIKFFTAQEKDIV